MKKCPNCEAEFSDSRFDCHYCSDCDMWFRNIDGQWHTTSEPAKQTEPKPVEPEIKEAVPVREPVPADKSEPAIVDSEARLSGDRHIKPVKQYFNGLLTVTRVDDEDESEDEENDD